MQPSAFTLLFVSGSGNQERVVMLLSQRTAVLRETLLSSCAALFLTLPAVAADETPTGAKERRSFFTVGLGTRFVLADKQALSDTRQFVHDNILRTHEVIYNASGVALSEKAGAYHIEPALRTEWEIPVQKFSWLSMLAAFEAGWLPGSEIFLAAGNFRYQNAQAANAALTDLTYSGRLSVTERRFQVAPMLGLGLDFKNGWLTRFYETHLLARLSLGVMLASGQRTYTLALAPQFVGAVNDTYVITSEMVQSYSMAVLPAARAEIGARARLSPRLHLALLLSVTAVYGTLGWEKQGNFAERAGSAADKIIYQVVVSGIDSQAYVGLAPAIFLALSTEL